MRFLEALTALAKLLHKLSETTGLRQLDDIAYALAVFLLLCLGGIYILGIFLYVVEKLQRPRPVKAPRGLTLLRLSSPVEPGDRPLRSVNQTFRAHSIAITSCPYEAPVVPCRQMSRAEAAQPSRLTCARTRWRERIRKSVRWFFWLKQPSIDVNVTEASSEIFPSMRAATTGSSHEQTVHWDGDVSCGYRRRDV